VLFEGKERFARRIYLKRTRRTGGIGECFRMKMEGIETVIF